MNEPDKSPPSPGVFVEWVRINAASGSSVARPPDSDPISRLFPHLPHLIEKLAERQPSDKLVDFHWRMAMLPYSLASAYAAYLGYAASARALASAFNGAQLVVGMRETYDLRFAIDAFLESGRRAQNSLTRYLSSGTRQSIPESLNDVMKRLHGGKLHLPENIGGSLEEYWRIAGEKLKHYRDLGQHHALVASHVTVFRGADGRVALKVLLPSNPSNKSELIWGEPPVHAQAFLNFQMNHLIGVAYVVTKLLHELVEGHDQLSVGFYPRTPEHIGAPVQGYVPQEPDAIAAGCANAASAAERYVAALLNQNAKSNDSPAATPPAGT